ncbi:MAG: hypothetical protein E3J72_13300 [Planctomycetota bacterium]|nr:MAG: hypothetical protein E3J72_13300 [Planctomycetota bacterium]
MPFRRGQSSKKENVKQHGIGVKHFLITSVFLTVFPFACGCASYEGLAGKAPPAYGKLRTTFGGYFEKSRKPIPREERYENSWLQHRANWEFKRRFDKVMGQPVVTGEDIDRLNNDLLANQKLNAALGPQDAGYRAWLRQHYQYLREQLNAKLLEVLRIEPTVDISEGTKAKIAIIKIGEEDTETIREKERKRWIEFFRKAGFKTRPVFPPEYLVCAHAIMYGEEIRIAAARLGARAVLIYAVSVDTDMSWVGESIATLAVVRCMLVDTKTEYLYLNAEGDVKEKRVRLPGMIDRIGFEAEMVEKAMEVMRREILHELERIREEK